MTIDVVGAAIIKNYQILLVRTRRHPRTWIFPGGVWEEGESPEQCLEREISEELPGLRFRVDRFVGVYRGVVNGRRIRLTVYNVKASGAFKTGDEIIQARWVGDLEATHLAEPTAKAIAVLKKRGEL